MVVKFHHGIFCDSYEKQANAQGFTFGDKAEWVDRVGYGLICAHMHECITDEELDKILHRFQTNILIKNIKPLEEKKNKSCNNCKWNNSKKCQPITCTMIGYDGHGLWESAESEG